MSTPALTLTGLADAQISVAPDAHERRSIALNAAARVGEVADAMDAEDAADALRLLAALSKETEAARKIVKEPVLALGKKIDETAKTFIADVEREKARIETALGTHQAAERRKADEARRAAEIEANRKAAEAARAAIVADHAATQAEADRAQQAAAKAEVEAAEARIVAAEISPTKPAGVAVRETWKFEVTDINALFKARPDLCLIEPNNAAIRAQIQHNQSLPGLRIWQEAKASIR